MGRRLRRSTVEAGLFACLAALYLGGLVVDGRVAAAPGWWLVGGVLLFGLVGILVPLDRLHPHAALLYGAASFVPQGVALTMLSEPPHTFTLFVFAPFVWIGIHVGRNAVHQVLPIALLCTLVPTVIVDRSVGGVTAIAIAIGSGAWVGLLLADHVAHQRRTLQRTIDAERTRAAVTRAFAHDVAQPLTVISGNLGLLEEHDDLPLNVRRRLLAGAHRHAKRLAELASTLLDVDRVQHGQLRLDREPLPVAPAVEEAARLADLEVTLRIDPDAAVVVADPARFEQILVNLLTNVRRHGEPPVVVSSAVHDDHIEIRVRDHGPGLATATDDVFEPFGSVSAQRGNGLGLSIVRALVEAHGGTVRAELADPGLEMVVTLPRAEADGR